MNKVDKKCLTKKRQPKETLQQVGEDREGSTYANQVFTSLLISIQIAPLNPERLLAAYPSSPVSTATRRIREGPHCTDYCAAPSVVAVCSRGAGPHLI